ncbi:hypothetical protein [Flammeovirga pacifica]|uniref:LysM domain-containing protein n=1 Tax=Flammeovirga pacifica TaxID=915059 RepID=A0A1S1YV79_FLAPC|nr:hypothetical protein [Flammeovirga pacifica]OHX64735.1 hypothetical protein NH26_24540 [Flammeovirga pacifica]
MKNLILSLLLLTLTCFTTSAGLAITDKKQPTEKEASLDTSEQQHHFNNSHNVAVNSYMVNVGRGATYFGISKKLSKVSGIDWSWDLVDRVQESHQIKYEGEILKPNQKFAINL